MRMLGASCRQMRPREEGAQRKGMEKGKQESNEEPSIM